MGRLTPVQLVASPNSFRMFTELERQQGREPAFALHPKMGLACRGIPMVSYEPQTILATASHQPAPTTAEVESAAQS